MKTRDIVFYTTLAVAALAMAGCEKSNDMPQESGPGLPAEIRFAPAIVPLTRATGTAFEEGDTVGIYCVESTDDPAAAIVGERYIDNKQLTMTAGTLTGTTPCFWPTEYTGLSDFYAYFPYNEKGLSDDKQSYEISVALDQSDDEAFRHERSHARPCPEYSAHREGDSARLQASDVAARFRAAARHRLRRRRRDTRRRGAGNEHGAGGQRRFRDGRSVIAGHQGQHHAARIVPRIGRQSRRRRSHRPAAAHRRPQLPVQRSYR